MEGGFNIRGCSPEKMTLIYPGCHAYAHYTGFMSYWAIAVESEYFEAVGAMHTYDYHEYDVKW